YLHLGAKDYEWQELPVDLFNEIESFARRGGRLAIALAPVTSSNRFLFSTITVTNAAGTNAAGRKRIRKIMDEDEPRVRTASIQERWGVSFDYEALEQGDDEVYRSVQVTNATTLRLPPELDWHSGLVVTNHDARWRVIYSRGTNAVVVERQFGSGTLVLATDSYFLSNEAMWVSRHPELLAWFVGPATQVVFDEAHLGVMETSGVAVLMRKYRLYGVIGVLVVLAGLFIWKNTVSLVPPHAAEVRRDYVIGKDAAGGFVNLLRRNIPSEKVLEVCFEEWTKSLTRATRHTIASVDRASEIMETRQGNDSVDAYQRIAKALKSSRFQVSRSRSEAATQTQTTNEH
ncbi:MAG TPA: hypothetical protein VFZ59_13070, partial [Verrucomicrobiae bacterium]|nr:hypothetical protein [Verrucomicrobiae bacterium]